MPNEPGLKFPLVIAGSGWRRRAKLALGYTAAALMPARVKAIETGTIGEHLSAADRLIVGALVHRAIIREEPLDHLAYLHRHYGTVITSPPTTHQQRIASTTGLFRIKPSSLTR